jgi:hypothetical protein
VETGVPGEKLLQAKLRADYFSLSLFLYLVSKIKIFLDSMFIEILFHAVFIIL